MWREGKKGEEETQRRRIKRTSLCERSVDKHPLLSSFVVVCYRIVLIVVCYHIENLFYLQTVQSLRPTTLSPLRKSSPFAPLTFLYFLPKRKRKEPLFV